MTRCHLVRFCLRQLMMLQHLHLHPALHPHLFIIIHHVMARPPAPLPRRRQRRAPALRIQVVEEGDRRKERTTPAGAATRRAYNYHHHVQLQFVPPLLTCRRQVLIHLMQAQPRLLLPTIRCIALTPVLVFTVRLRLRRGSPIGRLSSEMSKRRSHLVWQLQH